MSEGQQQGVELTLDRTGIADLKLIDGRCIEVWEKELVGVDTLVVETFNITYHFKDMAFLRQNATRMPAASGTLCYIPLRWGLAVHKGDAISNMALRHLGCEWYEIMGSELLAPYMRSYGAWIRSRRELPHINVYPTPKDVFRAFRASPFHKVRVVIVGQDPYHQPGQADGLAFSSRGGKIPPSLRVIFQELRKDMGGYREISSSHKASDLSDWARQGVFLMNRYLTVEEGRALSHKSKEWAKFTRKAIIALSDGSPKVFMLWGKMAQELEPLIDTTKHKILKASHPAAEFHGSGGTFYGCRHFSQASKFIQTIYNETIQW